jgi:quaternary ammonium compound-resistance protein SugE
MGWLTLLVAGLLEVAFAASLKPSEGFSRLGPSLAVIAFGTAAVITLTRTLDRIPVGTAYAAFTGIGAVGTVLVGILAYHEPVTVARLASIALVIAGVIGLRLASQGG